ncbi:MAG: 2-amino-4-hydroxy-6-hydroxymethyldihydropteridine diphosphokinase [Vicingus serpentipes]|nr:2-amino-4-hydroxy-6-hydroxymethyldihydropteridine diphosphokinase [Vicingus serpentipes]
MKQVVLGLGGNIGDTKKILSQAIHLINEEIGAVKLKSSLYQTKAWGVENQPDFINAVIAIETTLLPHEVLETCLSIEKKIGRDRLGKKKWTERMIDIDVLFYENEIIDTFSLKLPHSHIHERNFVLYPLAEILPNFKHPVLGKTALEMKNQAKDRQMVTLLKDKI